MCQGISTGGAMVKGGTAVTHKCIRTQSSKISTFDLQQTKIFESNSLSCRQHHCTTLPCEYRANREPNVTEIKQRNLTVSLETPDHNYFRIPSKFFQRGGRLAVSKQQGSIRMETLPKVFQQVCERREMTKIDLFASRLSHQLLQYFLWKPDPFSQGTDALQDIWRNQFLYAFPPFCLILQVLKKVSYDQTEKVLLVTLTWQSQIWCTLLLEMSIVRPLLLPRNTSLIKLNKVIFWTRSSIKLIYFRSLYKKTT